MALKIKINGKSQVLEKAMTLFDLIKAKGLNQNRIAIEYNQNIIDKDSLSGILIKENDSIEIVNFIGGGR
tara:strand:- start:209 stop:418 length:210 start_codon:yes stop_codon:yes gene_type:complete